MSGVSGTAWAAGAVAALLAVGDWVAVARERRAWRWVTKPGALVGLLVAALALHPVRPAEQTWFVVALVCSLAGDVFLLLPHRWFVAGIGSFLVAHLAFIGGLVVRPGPPFAYAVAAVPVGLAARAVAGPVLAGVRARRAALVRPVMAYVAVLSVMAVVALATTRPPAAAAGAAFFVSDGLLAWQRFVAPGRWRHVAVMVTYHAAQALFVVSLVTR